MPEDRAAGHGTGDGRAEAERQWHSYQAGEPRTGRRDRTAALDRLTKLATHALHVAAAQVSLIGEQQRVVGAAGTAATRRSPTPATEALCALVAHDAAPLRVDDALTDARVTHLPSVADGTVGAYLGVPLRVAGFVVGAVCVFEPHPRQWSETDVDFLSSLAQTVAAELELADLEASVEDERVLWQLAIDASEVGAFDWDLVTGELNWDGRSLELFGLDRDTFGGTIEAFNAVVHPDDRDRVTQALADAVETVGTYTAEYRVLLPSGDLRWISARGRAMPGPDGRAIRLLGAASDTTAEQADEARVARVLESMPTAFFSLDRSWRVTYANSEAKRLLGGIGVEWVGGVLWELFPAAVGSEFERQYRHAMASGEPVTFEAYYPPPLDAHYEVRGWPTPEGLSVYFIDITARHHAQEELDRASRRSTLLAEAGAEMADTWDGDTAVGRLARLVVPELGEWCLVTLTDHGRISSSDWRRGLRDVGGWHVDEARRSLVSRYAATRVPALTDASFFARALRSAAPIVVPTDATDAVASVLSAGEARDALIQLAPTAAAVVPMRARGRTLGLLSIFRGAGHPGFDAADLVLLKELGDRAGLALDNARLYAEQRDLAGELQRSMMTPPPEPDHLHVAVRYQPAAEVAQVGGDWYDSFLQPQGATVVVIGDVLGHDSAAAAAMGQLRNILRGVAAVTEASPAQLLSQVDQAMSRLLIRITATVVVARLEQTPEERRQGVTRLRWSNAGHPPPVVVTHPRGVPQGTEVLWGERSDVLLGLEPTSVRAENVVTLPRGSTLLFYTDGLVERRGEVIDEGIDRLAATFTELIHDGYGLEELCDELLRRLLPDDPEDDVALVAVRLLPED
ncbi:SpoIIE family protein phosphatase [Nocardioides sp. BP30]|uniref:SpoIIE family protein phosphatase n=1 Tax=Nocardioides sp. BP30 TaxID=3036374 RepID=UPI00246822FA|nr:SpoIIE family protein phosphatase [Nocardioides sp. BP30]WGL50557.1 SpoIIE family protein phosphatase [Nocardioides sp. BP30]